MFQQVLLAIESIAQRLRSGRISPWAIEGMCRHDLLFRELGEACRLGRLTGFELRALRDKHLGDDDSVVSNYNSRRRFEAINALGCMLGGFVSPEDFEGFFRGHIRFTREQSEQLSNIPYSREFLEFGGHSSILFPGHPDVSMRFLLQAFTAGIGAAVNFNKVDAAVKESLDERGILDSRLSIGWYLIRRKPEPIIEKASFTEQVRRVDEKLFRLPQIIEFATASLLSIWRGRDNLGSGEDLMKFGAWCVEPKKSKEGCGWMVGPYERINEEKSMGLSIAKLDANERTPSAQLFLVCKPDK